MLRFRRNAATKRVHRATQRCSQQQCECSPLRQSRSRRRQLEWLWSSSHSLPCFTWAQRTCPNQKIKWLCPPRNNLLLEATEAGCQCAHVHSLFSLFLHLVWSRLCYITLYHITYYKVTPKGWKGKGAGTRHLTLGHEGGAGHGESPELWPLQVSGDICHAPLLIAAELWDNYDCQRIYVLSEVMRSRHGSKR